MQRKYTKKLIGTVLMSIMIISLSLVGFSYAQAQFLDLRRIVNIDGILESISATSITINTNGSEAITFEINRHTVFADNTAYPNYLPGETVKIIAKVNANRALAKVIKKNNSAGYGCQHDYVLIRSAHITSIAPHSITVEDNLSTITLRITTSTWFVNTSFSHLAVGDKVQIGGYDSGSEFVANAIYKYKH